MRFLPTLNTLTALTDQSEVAQFLRNEYKPSLDNLEKYWGDLAAEELHWFKPWDSVLSGESPNYKWFEGAKINITTNCLDRHIQVTPNKVAYIEVTEDGTERRITYAELGDLVGKVANGLKSLGVNKGDRIVIYMPLVIEQVAAMLACARIGAIHSVVFAGFSDKALRQRIEDSGAKVVFTANWTKRRGKKIELKAIVDEAVEGLSFVEHIIVLQRDNDKYQLTEKELDFTELAEAQSPKCQPEEMAAEDPLFILYTSGSTGKPKGVIHTQAGYNLYVHHTTKTVFDVKPSDIFWCTADPGWITGHSYIVYGPLSNGMTSIIAEGAPDFPTPDRWWQIVEKYQVAIFYTSPTAIRLLRSYGDQNVQVHDLDSLRILGSVGEPIAPEVWQWYSDIVGEGRCQIVDTWWQTETGGHMIVTKPSLPQKPGSAGLPLPGIGIEIVDEEGKPKEVGEIGHLLLTTPWPGALRGLWNDKERFKKYWNQIPGKYFTGDLASRDAEGYITIMGRSDDVINIAGHRIGTAEIEAALLTHNLIAEAAAIGVGDAVKGEVIKAFVVMKKSVKLPTASDELKADIKLHIRREIGSFAVPAEVEIVQKLPKTRSGKIMRRVLRAQEQGLDTGDLSTLED